MDAADVVADGSPFWDFLAQAHREGFTKLSGPPELGGLGLSRLEEFLVMEEITTGDAGLSAVLFLAPFSAAFAYQLGSPELVEEISRPYFSGADPRLHSCWAITEMGHGSDMLTGHTPSLVSDARGDCVAHRDGDDWVVDGAKSSWVSSGPRRPTSRCTAASTASRWTAACSPSCRRTCRASARAPRSTSTGCGRSTRARSSSTTCACPRATSSWARTTSTSRCTRCTRWRTSRSRCWRSGRAVPPTRAR